MPNAARIRMQLQQSFCQQTQGVVAPLGVASQSFVTLPGGTPVMFRSGTIERESRAWTPIRTVDWAVLTAAPRAAMCVQILGGARLGLPITPPLLLPVSLLRQPMRQGTITSTARYVVKWVLNAGAQNTSMVYLHKPKHIDVTRYLASDPSRFLFDLLAFVDSGGTLPVPSPRNHSFWLSVAAAVLLMQHFQVSVAIRDINSVLWWVVQPTGRSIFRFLPGDLASVPHLLHSDVSGWRHEALGPEEIIEVEIGNDILASLWRCNGILCNRRAAGQLILPTFRIVAEEGRLEEFLQKLNNPAFHASGLATRCRFQSLRSLYYEYGTGVFR